MVAASLPLSGSKKTTINEFLFLITLDGEDNTVDTSSFRCS